MATRFFSVDPNTTNQSTETWYLSADEARQADLAAKFLDHPSHVIMPENSDAAEQARKSSEQLAQVTQESNRQKVIPTPLWILLSQTGCTDSIKDDDTGNLGFEGETYEVGCDDSEFDEIQDAVDAASDGDIIEVCDGTYPGFSIEDKSLSVKAKKGHSPKIDLSANPDYGEISVKNPTTSGLQLFLSGFEIYGGSSTAINIIYGEGNVYLELSDLEIYDSSSGIGIGNDERADGSGSIDISVTDISLHNLISSALYFLSYSDDSFYTLNLDNIEAYENEGFPAIMVVSVFGENISLTGNDLNVHDNNLDSSDSNYASGITLLSVEASINNSTIANNTANYGAGIYLENSTLILTDTTVKDNVATNSNDIGGGLQLLGTKVTAHNTNWEGNKSYDVYVGNPSSFDSNLAYDYGTNSSFECEYEVGCTDL